MDEFMTSWRRDAAPWPFWMDRVEQARVLFAQLIHANPDDVATVSCASEAAFQVASVQAFTPDRPVIVSSDLEFPSIAHVWLAQEAQGAAVHFIRHHGGVISPGQYEEAIDERVKLVSVPVVSYANGHRFAVEQIAANARAAGARVVVDAYQAAGVVSLDVRTLGADYLFSGTLKYLLGSPGLAFLWVNPRVQHDAEPVLTGWFGRSNPYAFTPDRLDWAPGGLRFQTGTPAIAAAFAAQAGLALLAQCDGSAIERHVSGLTEALQQKLSDQGWELFSPKTRQARGPQVSILSKNPEALARYLVERHIFASPRGSALRLSLHYYNNQEDLAWVAEALSEWRATGREDASIR